MHTAANNSTHSKSNTLPHRGHRAVTSARRLLPMRKSTRRGILLCPHPLVLLLLQLPYHSIKDAGLRASLAGIVGLEAYDLLNDFSITYEFNS